MVQELYVISGGPSTGKTATINEIKRRGYNVLPEAARKVATTDKRFIGKSIKQINKKYFQDAIFDFQSKQLKKLKLGHIKHIFLDRGFGDTLAYYGINNLKVPNEKFDAAKKVRYEKVFILNFLDFYEQDKLRKETKKEQKAIHKAIIGMYKKLGYGPIIVPFMNIKGRADFILSRIKNLRK